MDVDCKEAKFFFKTVDGETVELNEVQEVSIVPDEVKDYGFNRNQEISGVFTWEVPENIKELKGMGFTDQQAWNIHLHKGESWKLF